MLQQDSFHGSSEETFERAPPPASRPATTGQLVFPPGRKEEAEAERLRRQRELAGDEELARQLAEQLRLTSPVEHGSPSHNEPLPRVGDGRGMVDGELGDGARVRQGEGQRDGSQESPYFGVEYHALDSDGEDAFFEPPARTGIAGYAPKICSVLTGIFRPGSSLWRGQRPQVNSFDVGLG